MDRDQWYICGIGAYEESPGGKVNGVNYCNHRSTRKHLPPDILIAAHEAAASMVNGCGVVLWFSVIDFPGHLLVSDLLCSRKRAIGHVVHRYLHSGGCRLPVKFGVLAVCWAVSEVIYYGDGNGRVHE